MPNTQLVPHAHISAIDGVKVGLYVFLFIGAIHIVARRFEGHPAGDAILNIWA